ncbi:hypothetical protein ZWY2020_010504 [Hordeum vulgare]|nr:hypothetical protein ZWY2020_010504 [Hordeum vulgare]
MHGSMVVYLPEGSLAGGHGDTLEPAGPVHMPPHVACRLIDVKLYADAATDKVCTQLTLVVKAEVSVVA